jgi:uncharacterized protein (TIGR00375 family)
MEVPMIARWAAIKGIALVGTGDWTHPLWLGQLKGYLEEVEEGVFGLKKEMWEVGSGELGDEIRSEKLEKVRFLLVTEISSIYTQGGKQRRIHNLVFAPSFSVVEGINNELLERGCNLNSDGRPIIGLSARNLAELVFSVSEDCLLIPAHAWTPWFSLFGANSGFDSLKECFGEFSERIYAIESGLSSDPAMNWRIEELDNKAIMSFSDAHSPKNLGREATVFQLKAQNISYQDVAGAIRDNADSNLEIAYTIEFFPEEGKYHYTGHRNCEVCHSPEETAKLGAICPICGKKMTVGVMHRVQQLAEREVKTQTSKLKSGLRMIYDEEKKRTPYIMLVPLLEIIAESLGLGKGTKGVENEYFKLISFFGSEFNVLLNAEVAEIARISGERIAGGIKKVRDGDLYIKPGFDGVFGKVKIWEEEKEEDKEKEQLVLF